MIEPSLFYQSLYEKGMDFFTGVPDSLLQTLCACLSERAGRNYVIAANEGNAVGIAAGHYLATGKPGVVFLQNSGIGNAVNPLLSLADPLVYRIPMLLLIGWRGEPGTQDEPQHKKQGLVTISLLESMGIPVRILDANWEDALQDAAKHMQNGNIPALLIRKGTFSEYPFQPAPCSFSMTREHALSVILSCLSPEDFVVSTTGKTSRELFELRQAAGQGHGQDFLTVGSMGHASSIALGLSLASSKNIYCIDGDGAFLMHMGACAVNGCTGGDNFKYIVLNNGCHESVGGQKTVGFQIHMEDILEGCGFAVCRAETEAQLRQGMKHLAKQKATLVVYIRPGSRADLGRPTSTPEENKHCFMEAIQA